jgi:hypothetical protein
MDEQNCFDITEELVRKLLTKDALDRKRRSWKILSNDEMYDLREKKMYTGIKKESLRKTGNLVIYTNPSVPYERNASEEYSWGLHQIQMINNLEQKFHFITSLLQKFEGKLYACGGAVFKSQFDECQRMEYDIDIFFVNPNPNETEQNQLLEDVLTYLSICILSIPDNDVFITRNQHVVTFYSVDQTVYTKYQFILRVYPSLESILGGFDLGPSMVAYDGKRILATEFGAWSFMSAMIIVDTSRRSTTYERRLNKYLRYCNVIFPGLDIDVISKKIDDHLTFTDFVNLLESEIRDMGYFYDEENAEFTPDHTSFQELSKPALIEEVKELVRKNGYNLCSIELTEREKRSISELISEEELYTKIKELAHENGYYVNLDERPYALEDMCVANFKIELPYLSLRVEKGLQKGILVSSARWSNKQVNKNSKTFNFENITDYNDNQAHPYLTVQENQTCLSNNRPGHTCTFILLQSFLNKQKYDFDLDEEKNIRAGYTAILDGYATTPTSDTEIRAGIRKLMLYGSLGNLIDIRESNLRKKHYLRGQGELYNFRNFLRRHFAEFADEIYTKISQKAALISDKSYSVGEFLEDERIAKIESIIRERIGKNQLIAEEILREIRWITKNPGRQWTSSINPIIADPRDWYGKYYKSFRICNYEVEITLRAIRNIKNSSLSKLGKDVFDMLLFHIFY